MIAHVTKWTNEVLVIIFALSQSGFQGSPHKSQHLWTVCYMEEKAEARTRPTEELTNLEESADRTQAHC